MVRFISPIAKQRAVTVSFLFSPSMSSSDPLSIEDPDSRREYLARQRKRQRNHEQKHHHHHQHGHRILRHQHHHKHTKENKDGTTLINLDAIQEDAYQTQLAAQQQQQQYGDQHPSLDDKAHQQRMDDLYSNPGIARGSTHGIMIDAGSTGSRLHLYEWEPRVLRTPNEINQAVSGNRLSVPGTESRWTERLQPGLGGFGSICGSNSTTTEEELQQQIADYLRPLLQFAETILHEKAESWGKYPIYLRATAGMRILPPEQRARVISAVRAVLSNTSISPFAFSSEQVRVISGEEEAIFDWTGVNFLLGNLVRASEGVGTANSRTLHGALDLGGASTQIAFYEPTEDIMSNLFKLQIGQAKHWNVYAHSFLFYGINEAIHRFNSRLIASLSPEERLVKGVHNPCFPTGYHARVRTDIHLSSTNVEAWNKTSFESTDGYYHGILHNDGSRTSGDFEMCSRMTKELLHLEFNVWCSFAHLGDCSLAGIYQPRLPTSCNSSEGEFVAFSNYYRIWKFLQLPERATLAQLLTETKRTCAMSRDELLDYNVNSRVNGKPLVDPADLETYCFRSVYAFQLLHNGYGFGLNDTIRATKVIAGHKVGWALGAMLYEINTMPWQYVVTEPTTEHENHYNESRFRAAASCATNTVSFIGVYLMLVVALAAAALVAVLTCRNRRKFHYEAIKSGTAGELKPLVTPSK